MSYQQLLDIVLEAEAYRRQYVETSPVACPDDGALLDSSPLAADLHCPWGHFVVLVNDQWVTRSHP